MSDITATAFPKARKERSIHHVRYNCYRLPEGRKERSIHHVRYNCYRLIYPSCGIIFPPYRHLHCWKVSQVSQCAKTPRKMRRFLGALIPRKPLSAPMSVPMSAPLPQGVTAPGRRPPTRG